MKKSIVKNSIYNVVYKGMDVLFPLITTMYASRIILPSGIGNISSAQNLATYFVLLSAMGIPTYGTKKIAEYNNDLVGRNKCFTELLLINTVSTSICVIAYLIFVFCFEGCAEERTLYLVVGCQIFFNFFTVDWFYRGIEEYGYIMKRSIVVKIISFSAMLLLVRTKSDYIIYAAISMMGIAFNQVINLWNLRKKVRLNFSNLNIKRHIKPVIMLLAASIAIEIYTLADTTMLTYMCSSDVVGYYANSVKSIKIIKNFIVSICAVFLPRLSCYCASGEMKKFKELVGKGVKTLIFFALPATIGVFLLSQQLVMVLFGEEFQPAVFTTMILSPSIVTIAISNFVGYQVLVASGYERYMFFSTWCGAVVNIMFNMILIPLMQQNGAAIASVATELIVAVVQYIFMIRLYKIKLDIHFLCSTIISSIAVVIIVIVIKLIHISDVGLILLAVPFGVLTYFLVSLATGNEITKLIFGKAAKVLKKGV